MKKIILTLTLLTALSPLRAQDTIFPLDTNYLLYDSSYMDYTMNRFFMHGLSFANTSGRPLTTKHVELVRHILPQPVPISGLAIPLRIDPNTPQNYNHYFWGVVAKITNNDSLHPTLYFTNPISAKTDRPYDRFISIQTHSKCDNKDLDTTIGAYSLYFDSTVTLSDTAWIGITHWCDSPYDELDYGNHFLDIPLCFHHYHRWYGFYLTIDSNIVFPGAGFMSTSLFPIYPILAVPDTDTFSCPPVDGLSFAGLFAGSPTFVWNSDSLHSLYQIAYGPYNSPVDSHSVVSPPTSQNFLEIHDPSLSPDIYYFARIRANCHHECPVHDTTLWTPWSDPVPFFIGQTMPDTSQHETIPSSLSDTPLLSLSPNPADNSVSISLSERIPNPGNCSLSLLDAAGHELFSLRPPSHSFLLRTDSLPAGTYFLSLLSPLGSHSLRLVISHNSN